MNQKWILSIIWLHRRTSRTALPWFKRRARHHSIAIGPPWLTTPVTCKHIIPHARTKRAWDVNNTAMASWGKRDKKGKNKVHTLVLVSESIDWWDGVKESMSVSQIFDSLGGYGPPQSWPLTIPHKARTAANMLRTVNIASFWIKYFKWSAEHF